jgi:hypothetical protein
LAQQLKISITILVCSCFNRTNVVLSFLLPPPLQFPNFCLEPSKFCLSATPSNSRNASKYRNNKASNTKRGFPLSCRLNQSRSSTVGLWRRSQARSKWACSGPIHVHGLAKCSPFTIESIYGKLQLHARLARAGQSSAGKRATSTAVDSTGLQRVTAPKNLVRKGVERNHRHPPG